MKKLVLTLTMILALLICGTALASGVTLGNTGITLTLPSGYQEDTLDSEDISEGAVGCWIGSRLVVIAYVADDDATLDEVLTDYASESGTVGSGYCSSPLGGLTFAYVVYEESDTDGTYYGADYFTVVDGRLVDICFFAESEDDLQLAEDIMSTLKYSGNAATVTVAEPVAPSETDEAVAAEAGRTMLGNTRVSIELPSGYMANQLTEDDTLNDEVNEWYSDTLFIMVYVYAADGATPETIEASLASEGYSTHGVTTLTSSGLTCAYGVYNGEESGTGYTVISYMTVVDDQVVQLAFMMTDDDVAVGSAAAAQIMESMAVAQ